MGGFCETSIDIVADPKDVLKDTEIPEWVSEGGQKLFEKAVEIAEGDYPPYEGERLASYDQIGDLVRDDAGVPMQDPETGEYLRSAVEPISFTDPETGEIKTVTPMSKLTEREQRGLEMLETEGDVYQQYIDEAESIAKDIGDQTIDSGTFDYKAFGEADVKPYIDIFQDAIDPALLDIEETFKRRQRDLKLAAGKTGAFGDRMGLEGAELTRGEARETGRISKEAGREGLEFAASQYERDRAAAERQFELNRIAGQTDFDLNQASRKMELDAQMALAPTVQGLMQQEAQGLIAAGEAERVLEQQALDMAYRDYLEQREYPFTALNFALGALKGLPYETREYTMARGGEVVQAPSIYGQTMGGLGALASAYKLLS
jgi:hypothetical protein